MTGVFTAGAPRLYTIAPGANFLDELANTLARDMRLADDPEALADTLVYVPNSRSKTALALALTRASGRGAVLLPDIRALGDLESDEPPPSAEAALANLPPVLPNAERIGQLTRLVMAYYSHQGLAIPATSALSAARELARLLDQAALSGAVEWADLKTLVPEGELAQHWQGSLKFLEIITKQWPAKLEEATAMDPYARRHAAAEAMAHAWASTPPQGPVIIAGSTGATPASRVLMQAALKLVQGRVILPGLDREMDDKIWNTLQQSPSHPQFTLARTLKALGVAPHTVTSWPMAAPTDTQSPRRRLIHEALAPADRTADWTERLKTMAPDGDAASFVRGALSGLSLIETADDTDEAMAAALLLRQTLESADQTAALITPDAGLARHVSVLLEQWGIEVAPSSGLPLLQTNAGGFAYLVMDWLSDLSHPVKLMAVLRHPLSRFDRGDTDTLDKYFLRGPRVWDSLSDLHNWLKTATGKERRKHTSYTDENITTALGLFAQIQSAIDTLGQNEGDTRPISGRDWFTLAAELMQAVADAPAPWQGDDGASLAKMLRDLSDMADPLGPLLPEIFTQLFKAEAAQVTVQLGNPHPRLAIWGPLEARLQTADRLILAGLNEGIWPAQPPADAFLPRVFRKKIGLSDPDERVGLSAHDFAQLAAAPDVTLLCSKRRDDKPVVASRWIWRLRTLARGALGKDGAEAALSPDPDNTPLDWIKALEQPHPLPNGFTAEPRPTPPVAARPKGLSVTRIETLIRDPYAIYCQYVLGLNKLDPLNLPGDVRIRGTAIHRALELFEEDGQDKSVDGLVTLLETELRNSGEDEADIIALHTKRREVAAEFITWRDDNAHQIEGKPINEEKGSILFNIQGEAFKLSGTADRIEKRIGGKVAILDFKSGKPPTEAQVRSGLSPQMPLQGLIAQRGGYKKLGNSVAVEALTYIRFGTAFDVQEIGRPGKRDAMPVDDIITDTEQSLYALLTRFADPDHPYLSAPRPERVSYWSDYTNLARRGEWTGLSTFDNGKDK